MDAGDFDGDGKIDLILGNCSYGPSVNKSATDWKKGPPFVILKNITQNKWQAFIVDEKAIVLFNTSLPSVIL